MTTHGEQRLGMLTSSTSGIIMRGGDSAWHSLRDHLWTATAEDFDKESTGAREFGHEQEESGVAKFWERHPEIDVIEPGGFHIYKGPAPLNGWVGSSPDRLFHRRKKWSGLEVKSPTRPELIGKHSVMAHNDQCQHGMLVTGLKQWVLVVHCGEEYREDVITPDKDWQKRYLQRAEMFWRFCYEDRPVARRKLSINDIRG